VICVGRAKSPLIVLTKEEMMAEKQPFEIPQQWRELAEKNVEQARAV
jgi:hypothetical protein